MVLGLVVAVLSMGAIIAGSQVVGALVPTAFIQLDPAIAGDSLSVRGVTDLPDGATIVYSITAGSSPEGGLGKPYVDDAATVVAGRFEEDVDIATFPSGPLTVWAAFGPGPHQPRSAIERFGADGSGLRGPGVVDDSGARRLVVIAVIDNP